MTRGCVLRASYLQFDVRRISIPIYSSTFQKNRRDCQSGMREPGWLVGNFKLVRSGSAAVPTTYSSSAYVAFALFIKGPLCYVLPAVQFRSVSSTYSSTTLFRLCPPLNFLFFCVALTSNRIRSLLRVSTQRGVVQHRPTVQQMDGRCGGTGVIAQPCAQRVAHFDVYIFV